MEEPDWTTPLLNDCLMTSALFAPPQNDDSDFGSLESSCSDDPNVAEDSADHFYTSRPITVKVEPPSESPSEGSSPCQSPLPKSTRSKMHELALRQNLITDQDPKGSGSLFLSEEERRTLVQEGLPVPARLPLTKREEEALKIVRRKIKNKLSAQESRRKRKEYMETLERRIDGVRGENDKLRKKMQSLESENRSLLSQLRRLQQGHSAARNVATQTSVCLTALLLLFVVFLPATPFESLRPTKMAEMTEGRLLMSEADNCDVPLLPAEPPEWNDSYWSLRNYVSWPLDAGGKTGRVVE